jgi:hypothetical protein
MKLSKCLCSAAFLSLIGVGSLAQANNIQEYFSMNTTGLAGTAGAVDLSFNPGLLSSTQSATVAVTQFAGAMLDPRNAASNMGDVFGALPNTLRFDNGKQLNDAFTPVIFGSSFNFVLTLSGPALTTPDPSTTYGSVFTVGLFSTYGTTPLITSNGVIATLNLNPGTATTGESIFAAGASFSPVPGALAPEPSTVMLLAGAILGGGTFCSLYRAKRRITAAFQARIQIS